MVTVQTHRDLSNLIAKTLGVRHETPVVVQDGGDDSGCAVRRGSHDSSAGGVLFIDRQRSEFVVNMTGVDGDTVAADRIVYVSEDKNVAAVVEEYSRLEFLE